MEAIIELDLANLTDLTPEQMKIGVLVVTVLLVLGVLN
jgi:hypothetical protein